MPNTGFWLIYLAAISSQAAKNAPRPLVNVSVYFKAKERPFDRSSYCGLLNELQLVPVTTCQESLLDGAHSRSGFSTSKLLSSEMNWLRMLILVWKLMTLVA